MVKKNRHLNIIWILVDSVRNYHTNADDRGRLDVMDEFAKNAVEFQTAITSAPSTVMSVSAMLTGIPAIFHSRTYCDFSYDNTEIKSLPLILKDLGYNPFSIIFFPEGRRFLAPMMGNLCEDYWPAHLNSKEFWSNDVVNEILVNLLQKNVIEPFFLLINYNCRYDPRTSDKVKSGMDILSLNGLLRDSIVILNSDHGYPDPSRNISFYQRKKHGHDLIMTDDNILTSMILYYPGCPRKIIKDPVSTLDIAPTILDLIGEIDLYDVSKFPVHGESLLGIISDNKDHSPLVRVDNRYIFQNNRITALRNCKYKYIYSFDDQVEQFYALGTDSFELDNLIKKNSKLKFIQNFRDEFRNQEDSIYQFHEKILRTKISKILHKEDRCVALIGDVHKYFTKMICSILVCLGIEKIFVLEGNSIRNKNDLYMLHELGIDVEFVDAKMKLNKKVDLMIATLVDMNPIKSFNLRRRTGIIKANRVVYVNYNLDIQRKPKFWLKPIVAILIRTMPNLKNNPKAFIFDIFLMAKKVLSAK